MASEVTQRQRAEAILEQLMERMMFRSLKVYSEGWATDILDKLIQQTRDETLLQVKDIVERTINRDIRHFVIAELDRLEPGEAE